MAGIAPDALSEKISKPRLVKLVIAIKEVLASAIAAGGSTLRDFAAPDGELGYFAKDWRVYGREGQFCGCGAAVKRRVDLVRSLLFIVRNASDNLHFCGFCRLTNLKPTAKGGSFIG